MSAISAFGISIEPFFIIKGKRHRVKFNNTFFKDSEIAMNDSGWMDIKAFRLWTRFFVESIKPMRGREGLWSLLIVDNHSSHCLDPEALKFLLDNQVLLVSIPSHSTSYLMPLDISIFHPLKRGFCEAQECWKRKNGLLLKIDDLPELLNKCWDNAHSKPNIKSGFTKSGIYPLSKNWCEENKQLFEIEAEQNTSKTTIEQFDDLVRAIKVKYNGPQNLIKACDYLNLSINSDDILDRQQKVDFEEILNSIYSNCARINHDLAIAKPKRKNKIGEDPGKSKILNSAERIGKLEEAKLNEKDKKKKTRKRKKDDLKNDLDDSDEETAK